MTGPEQDTTSGEPPTGDGEPLDPKVVRMRARRVAQGNPPEPSPEFMAKLYAVLAPPELGALRLRQRPEDQDRRNDRGPV